MTGVPDLRRRQDGLFCRRRDDTRPLRAFFVDLFHRFREELDILPHNDRFDRWPEHLHAQNRKLAPGLDSDIEPRLASRIGWPCTRIRASRA